MERVAIFFSLIVICVGCTQHQNHTTPSATPPTCAVQQSLHSKTQTAVVSFYHANLKGLKTANGELYNPDELTAAHRSLPFGTKIQFFNLKNAATVTVRINDRGPNIKGRDFDLSKAAAEKIGLTYDGVARLEYRILVDDEKQSKADEF